MYGLTRIGTWSADADGFHIELDDVPTLDRERCIYAFLDGSGQFVRIGSSKGKLRARMRAFVRDLTNAIIGRKSPCADWEPAEWRSVGRGEIHARPGTVVSTPVGTFSAYLDEESVLLGRHQPRLNRSWHR
jgi:hypothetical protein